MRFKRFLRPVMGVIGVAFFLLAVMAACDFNVMRWQGQSNTDSLKIQRYDRVQSRYLTTGDFAALQEMNTVYTRETRALIENVLRLGSVAEADINKRLLEFYRDSTLQNVIYAAESEFADMEDLNKELRAAFVTLHEQIPDMRIPKFYAQIGAFDESIIIDDYDVGISLDKYLGPDYPAYQRFYDKEQRKTMKRDYIVPDCIVFYLWSLYPPQNMYMLTQYERDMHIGKFMWVANSVTKKIRFKSESVDKVDKFMRQNPKVTIPQLLKMQTFQRF